MITLFRRIRQKLIDSGSVTKYLLYAFGEILLVMVGILLALQVSNWNEEKKKNADIIVYHQRLSEDLDLMLNDAEESMEFAESNFKAIKTSLNALNRGYLSAGEDSVFSVFLNRYFKFSLNIQDLNTYNEMQSAGKLELIQNVELRGLLSDVIDARDFFHEVHRTFHRDSHLKSGYLDTYVLYEFSEDNTDKKILYDYKAMAKDSVLIRKISRQAMLWDESMNIHNNLIDQIKEVIASLDNEMKGMN